MLLRTVVSLYPPCYGSARNILFQVVSRTLGSSLTKVRLTLRVLPFHPALSPTMSAFWGWSAVAMKARAPPPQLSSTPRLSTAPKAAAQLLKEGLV